MFKRGENMKNTHKSVDEEIETVINMTNRNGRKVDNQKRKIIENQSKK